MLVFIIYFTSRSFEPDPYARMKNDLIPRGAPCHRDKMVPQGPGVSKHLAVLAFAMMYCTPKKKKKKKKF
jgi:hypothetical protein